MLKGKGKKKIIIPAVVGLVAVAGLVGAVVVNRNAKDNTEKNTVYVEVKDLEQISSVTGTVVSTEVSTIYSGTSGAYPVAEVMVKVGDEVKAGDILYTLDMTSVEDELESALANQAITEKSNEDSINQAKQAVGDAIESV